MWWRARHPGWPRLLAAVALGPLVAPIVVTLLEPRPFEGLRSLLFYYPEDGGSFAGVAYVVAVLFGLPGVLVLAAFEKAGFIPVVLAGAVGGALCAMAGDKLIGTGASMFACGLAVATVCWLIAFPLNPRAQPQPTMGKRAKPLPRRTRVTH